MLMVLVMTVVGMVSRYHLLSTYYIPGTLYLFSFKVILCSNEKTGILRS